MKDFLTKPLTFVIVVIMTIIGVKVFDMSTAQAAKLSGANQALVDQYVAQSAPPAGNCDVASSSCVAASFTTTGAISAAGSITSTAGSIIASTGNIRIDGPAASFLANNASSFFQANTGSGSNAFQVNTNGARIDFGAGASDYASSDGSTVTFAGPLASASTFAATTGSFTGTLATSGATIQNSNTNASFFHSGSGTMTIESSASDATCTTAVPCISIKADTAVTADDLIFGVKKSDNTVVVKVTQEGAITSASTKTRGTITLSAGSGTATVLSGAICSCTDTTANASVKCAVATTTLTATGTGTDVIAYLCL